MPKPRSTNAAPRRGRNAASATRQSIPMVQLCGTCGIDVGDSAIGCDECETWVHDSEMCSGLPQDMIDAIARHNGEGIKFVCTKCRIESSSTRPTSPSAQANPQVVDLVAQLFQQLRGLCSSVQYLLELSKSSPPTSSSLLGVANPELTNGAASACHPPQAAQMTAPAAAYYPPPQTHSSDSYRQIVREELKELDEQRKRRNSLVVRGLASGNAEAAARRFEDVSEYLTGHKVKLTDVVKIQGESDLYRGKINDDEARKSLLDKAKRLKDSDQFQGVFIRRDLTYNQRQLLRARRAAPQDPMSGPPRPSSHTNYATNQTATNTSTVAPPPTDTSNTIHQESSTVTPPPPPEETVPKTVMPTSN